jgi:hypothetical protein
VRGYSHHVDAMRYALTAEKYVIAKLRWWEKALLWFRPERYTYDYRYLFFISEETYVVVTYKTLFGRRYNLDIGRCDILK